MVSGRSPRLSSILSVRLVLTNFDRGCLYVSLFRKRACDEDGDTPSETGKVVAHQAQGRFNLLSSRAAVSLL